MPILGEELADRNVALLLGHRLGRSAMPPPWSGRLFNFVIRFFLGAVYNFHVRGVAVNTPRCGAALSPVAGTIA